MKTKKLIYGFLGGLLVLPIFVSAGWRDSGLSNAQQAQLPSGGIMEIVKNIMQWLLAIVGVIGIIGFVISGILYLTAAGDSDQISRAKTAMTYSIIGVIVALMGYVIIKAADALLGGQSTTF